jgi:hypothetical protein
MGTPAVEDTAGGREAFVLAGEIPHRAQDSRSGFDLGTQTSNLRIRSPRGTVEPASCGTFRIAHLINRSFR